MQMTGNNTHTYQKLVADTTIAHGAFRLWHYLRHEAERGVCSIPGRLIAKEIHCNRNSLIRWTRQLVKGGYLTFEKSGQNHHYQYQIKGIDYRVRQESEAATRAKIKHELAKEAGIAPSSIPDALIEVFAANRKLKRLWQNRKTSPSSEMNFSKCSNSPEPTHDG